MKSAISLQNWNATEPKECSNEEYFAKHPEDYDTWVDDMAKMLFYNEIQEYPEDWVLGTAEAYNANN